MTQIGQSQHSIGPALTKVGLFYGKMERYDQLLFLGYWVTNSDTRCPERLEGR